MILLFLLIFSTAAYGVSVPLELDNSGKPLNKIWNGTTPFSVKPENSHLELFISTPDKKTYPLAKSQSKDFDHEDVYIYSLDDPSLIQDGFILEVHNPQRRWPYNKRRTSMKYHSSVPKLQLISATDTVTHGGAGIVVVESENLSDLSALLLLDEKGVSFYPNTFLKDGYYSILFTWYTDYSDEWSNQTILAMDKAGNTNLIYLNEITPVTRKYRQSTIYLPSDYAEQKAAELSLSAEEAKKLEGDITAINKAMAAPPRVFERWRTTRDSFKDSAKVFITNIKIFSEPSVPMRNARYTGTYGDRRKYYYKRKMVRTSVHRGLDYASYVNAPIYSLMDGVVVYADWFGGNGKTIVINHGFNIYTLYAHSSEILVEEGQRVKSGEQIAVSGTTGQSTGDHLHISVIVQGMYTEPVEWEKIESVDKLFHDPLRKAQKHILNQQLLKLP